MLASTLGRDVGHGAFDDFQKSLLHAFAGYVAGNGRTVGLAGNLVDFINIDNALAGGVKIIVGILEKLHQNVFHVLAYVTGFGKRGRVGYGEGYLEHTGQRAGQQCLSAAGRAKQQNVYRIGNSFKNIHNFDGCIDL